MTQTPKVVILDIGNVLLKWDPDRLYRELIPDEAERARFHVETGTHEMNLSIDRGAPFRATVMAQAEKFPEHADNLRAWHDRWLDMAYDTIDGSAEIMRRVQNDGIPVFALSNFGVDSFALAQRTYDILNEFDATFISGHMKMMKPEPEIYAAVEAETGFSQGDIVFFDDSRANIDAAQAAGWHAYLFETPEKMQSDLENVGILRHC